MSCTVKISSKGWAGQRRISSLPEETSSTYSVSPTVANIFSNSTPASTLILHQPLVIQNSKNIQQNKLINTSSNKNIAKKINNEDVAKLLKYIDDNVIGKNGTFFGPFGRRKVVYCDYAASGRSLQFLEDYIMKEVIPYLGDTRTSTSICSLQSSLFRHEAKDIIRNAVGAEERDAVFFTGHGTDDALRTLLHHLDLLQRSTVVFVGPFEHHTNLAEYGNKVVRIAETKEGFLDLNDLERKLIEEKRIDSTIVGYFSAASCVTGVIADDVATTLLLHQYGALSVWDYTSAAPHIQVDMNPHLPGVGETTVHKDAMIFSGHKFIGGAQSPGVLVVKKSLLRNYNHNDDISPKDPEFAEESGTAGVIESIRCGLAVQLKENLTPQAISTRQDKISRQVLAHIRTIPELILLGVSSQNIKRLPIFSFMVRHPRGTFLHHNFVCAILNDVFGIQARGGCACAEKYAYELMGIDDDLAKKYESVLMERGENGEDHAESFRPGFARISLPYFISEAELAFVLEALKMVATEGWKLLPQYVLNPDTGEWRHHTNGIFKERKCLGSIRYTDGKMVTSERRTSGTGVGIFPQNYSDCLQTARNIFNRARKMAHRYPLQIDKNSCNLTDKCEPLRWFILPREAQDLLLGNSQNVKQDLPFDPTGKKHRWRNDSTSNTNTHHSNVSIRRLNSDIPKSHNPPLSAISSPRHHSLPALSIDQTNNQSPVKSIPIPNNPMEKSLERSSSNNSSSDGDKSESSSSPSSTLSTPPVKFALGEAVTSSMILGTTPAGARLMAGENSIPGSLRSSRIRCNSLGSSANDNTLPVPIPLSPQTLANLGVNNGSNQSKPYRHCSCSSRLESNSLELDGISDSPTRSSPVSTSTSPTSSASPSPHPPYSSLNSQHNYQQHQHQQHHQQHLEHTPKLGRSSPILSSFTQSSEEDLRNYLKEVTKELATEIKSEIREVISKVDDVLSESNSSDIGTPQHHSSQKISNQEKQPRDDSFSASEIAEYLMEFSKEMASEVKSEIRCMVNQVDGLGRYSPDFHSTASTCSTGYGTPERRLPSSPLLGYKVTKTTKVTDLQQQQESKMSSECSSDETVIYVVDPNRLTSNKTATEANHERNKTSDEEEIVVDEEEDEYKSSVKNVIKKANGIKTLPEIYSAVNSVSSQDSGINLSFNENDSRTNDIGRSNSSSSGSSNSVDLFGNGINIKKNNSSSSSSSGVIKRRGKNDLSEDDDNEIVMEESILSSENDDDYDVVKKKKDLNDKDSNQWHSPLKMIWKPTVEAIHEYDMIKDKDKVLVCLPASTIGNAVGNYSLALLHTLHQYQFYAKSKNIDFEIGVVTIDANNSYDPIKSMTYFSGLEIPYFYEETEEQISLIDTGVTTPDEHISDNICHLCRHFDNNTKKRLYSVSKRYGYNVLALSQHLDNLTEGFLSSLFFTGKLKTIKAHYYDKEYDLRIVRPFIYVREKALKQFTDEKKLPIFRSLCETCEEIALQKSLRNKELMTQHEKTYPRLYWSMRTALKPLMSNKTNSNSSISSQRHKTKLKLKSSSSQQHLGDSESDDDSIL